jgi:hypothetical protein
MRSSLAQGKHQQTGTHLPQTQVSWFYLPENAASSCYIGYHLHVASPVRHIKPIVQSWAQTSKCTAERLPFQFLGSDPKSSTPTNRLSCSISAASCFSVKSAACSLLNAPATTPSSAFSYTHHITLIGVKKQCPVLGTPNPAEDVILN